MTVYIVRHGESEGNIKGVHQSEDELLTARGLKQATQVAHRFHNLSVDLILTSHATRARQTADEIAKVTNAPIQINKKLIEKKGPTQLIGTKHSTHESEKYTALMLQNIDDPQFHFADEENNWDFIARIDSVLQDIESYTEGTIVVVSHGFTIKALLGHMIFGDEFTSREFEQLKWKLETKNTGITVCDFSRSKGWKVKTINDFAHLLE